MAVTTGFNHIATVTSDLDRTKRFYADAFDADVSFEMAATPDHPRMAILELGGGAALNVFEAPADTIVGDRRTPTRSHLRPLGHWPPVAHRPRMTHTQWLPEVHP